MPVYSTEAVAKKELYGFSKEVQIQRRPIGEDDGNVIKNI